MLRHMKAVLVVRDKAVYPGGHVMEMVVWVVPSPVPPSPHDFKYRLFFGRRGTHIIGYDNERGKGDHRHYGDREEPYTFTDMATLLDDFTSDVERELKRRGLDVISLDGDPA
jgi:hypothetical protein